MGAVVAWVLVWGCRCECKCVGRADVQILQVHVRMTAEREEGNCLLVLDVIQQCHRNPYDNKQMSIESTHTHTRARAHAHPRVYAHAHI